MMTLNAKGIMLKRKYMDQYPGMDPARIEDSLKGDTTLWSSPTTNEMGFAPTGGRDILPSTTQAGGKTQVYFNQDDVDAAAARARMRSNASQEYRATHPTASGPAGTQPAGYAEHMAGVNQNMDRLYGPAPNGARTVQVPAGQTPTMDAVRTPVIAQAMGAPAPAVNFGNLPESSLRRLVSDGASRQASKREAASAWASREGKAEMDRKTRNNPLLKLLTILFDGGQGS